MTPTPVRAAAALILAGALAVALPWGPARAQEAGRMRLALGYDGSLYVKVLDLEVEAEAGPRDYTARARLESFGVLAVFKRLGIRAESRGRVIDGRAEPETFRFNSGGRHNREVTVGWTGDDVTTAASPPYGSLGEPPATREQRLQAVDPVAQLMRLALKPADAQPCTGVYRFFDGKQRYDLDFAPIGPATAQPRERRLGLVDPERCEVRYREVAGFKKKPPAERGEGLKREIIARLARVGAEGPWVISQMTADTKLGAATISLARLKLTGARP